MKLKDKKIRYIKHIIGFLSIALLLVILTPSFSTNYQEALTAVQQNDLDTAQSILSQTLNRNPNDINSKALYAIVTYRQGNFEAAETQLIELSSNEQLSKNDSILYMLADVQNTLGFKQEALNTIITAYEVNPDNLSIQQLYTSIYYDLSDPYAAAQQQAAPQAVAQAVTQAVAPQTTIDIQTQQLQAQTQLQAQNQTQESTLITTRAMNTTASHAAPTQQTQIVQNALLAATQGTALVPEQTVNHAGSPTANPSVSPTINPNVNVVVTTSEITNSEVTNSATVPSETVTELTTSSQTTNTAATATTTTTAQLERPYTFEEASASYAANKFNLARAQLENILAGNPYHMEATKMLAQLAYRDGNIAQSVELYTRVTQSHGFIQNPQADVLYGLALSQRGLGDIEGAFNNAAQAILQTPNDETINKLYDSLTEQLAQQDTTSTNYTFEDALASYKDNDIELARLQLQQIVTKEPNNKEAITMLAYIIYRDGNSEQAEAMFLSLVNQPDFDENSDVLYGLALAQRNNGKLTDAFANIQRAQVAAPDREDVQNLHDSLANIIQVEQEKAMAVAATAQDQEPKLSFSFEDALEAYKANDIETAQAQFEALVAANPDDTDSAVLLAYIIYRSDSDKAVEMFTALTERADFTENSDVLYGLALSHRNSGNIEAAFTAIERAYIAAPDREDVADLYTKLAGALEEMKKTQAAEANAPVQAETPVNSPEVINEAINEIIPDEPALAFSFEDAIAAYKTNDIETAKTQFEGLVAANPDDTDSATLLAYIVYRSDATAAANMFQNIVNRPDFNENSDVLYGLALSQRNAGNLDAAFTAIERAYNAAPEREDVTELYAKLYAAINPTTEGS